MARKTIKVETPKNPDKQVDVIGKMLVKHDADPANSPLRLMQVEVLRAIHTAAKTHRDLYEMYEVKAKVENGAAKVKLGAIQAEGSGLFLMAQARDLLLAAFASNPRELDMWGWEVVEGTVVTKRPVATAKE